MIYNVKKSESVFVSNPGLDTNDRFSVCSDMELKYVFFFYDFKSPYAKMGDRERMLKCLIEAGYQKDKAGRWRKNAAMIINGNNKKILDAASEFKYIMKSAYPEYKVLRVINNALDTAVMFMETFQPTTAKEIDAFMKMTDRLPDQIKKKQEIEALLGVAPESDYIMEEDENERELSTLDRFNQESNEI